MNKRELCREPLRTTREPTWSIQDLRYELEETVIGCMDRRECLWLIPDFHCGKSVWHWYIAMQRTVSYCRNIATWCLHADGTTTSIQTSRNLHGPRSKIKQYMSFINRWVIGGLKLLSFCLAGIFLISVHYSIHIFINSLGKLWKIKPPSIRLCSQ